MLLLNVPPTVKLPVVFVVQLASGNVTFADVRFGLSLGVA